MVIQSTGYFTFGTSCDRCKSSFTYNLTELDDSNYVTCPCCGAKVPHSTVCSYDKIGKKEQQLIRKHLCASKAPVLINGLYIPLKDCLERFVGHNSIIYLYSAKDRGVKDEKTGNVTRRPIWHGMDWQISFGPGDEDYFKAHPDVEKCPYRECNVIKIGTMLDAVGLPVLYLDIDEDTRENVGENGIIKF